MSVDQQQDMMQMLTRYGTGMAAGGVAAHLGTGWMAGEALGTEAACAALARMSLYGIPMGVALMGAGAALVGIGTHQLMQRWMR